MASEKDKKARSERQDQEQEKSRARSQKDEARDMKRQDNEQSKNTKSNRNKQPEFKLEPGKSETTTDHDIIRRWIEERGGVPAAVAATESKDDPGLLRIDFPERGSGNRLEDVSWEEFFDTFEEKKLAFLYQERTKSGEISRFSKFVSREDKK